MGTPTNKTKAFKICSLLGGLDITRLVSSNCRHVFQEAIADVELIREFVSAAAARQGIVGGLSTVKDLQETLDWKGRGLPNKGLTTLDVGLGAVDDRPDRTMERYVTTKAEPLVGDHDTDLAIINSLDVIFPWIVDRKSIERNWHTSHQNGRSQSPNKEPFLFDSLYNAAFLGTYGEAWAYYPPLRVYGEGKPYSFGDVFPANYTSKAEAFVAPNLPHNNPEKRAFFSTPYADKAVPGLSLVTALAPVYFSGTFGNFTYNNTYLASAGLDIAVSSVSTLLDVLQDTLVDGSFGMLVDADFNVIVISQAVVDKVFPRRTGTEDTRVTYNLVDGSIIQDRRNQPYLVSDTIVQPLTNLGNANWSHLLESVQKVPEGQRGYDRLTVQLTGEENQTSFYVMFEDWVYVADWTLLVFAPSLAVDTAVNVQIVDEEESSWSLQVVKGSIGNGTARLANLGSLDAIVSVKNVPHWIRVVDFQDGTEILPGESLQLTFRVLTDSLDLGISSAVLSIVIQDSNYPDCFYSEALSLGINITVLPQDCAWNLASDSFGNCVCPTVEIAAWCTPYTVLLPVVLIPCFLLSLIAVYLFVDRKRKKADSVWAIQRSELTFVGDPPQVLGRGTFGLVLLAEYRGTRVAVKKVLPPSKRKQAQWSTFVNTTNDEIDPEQPRPSKESALCHDTHWRSSQQISKLKSDFIKEMRLLSKLRHPCITTIMGAVMSTTDDPLLVMEWMEHGSLYDLLHNNTMSIDGDLILPMLRDIAAGVLFLHSAAPQIIHGDLKAMNVLVDIKFRAKIADFGLSQKKKVGATGTPLWMAPELLRGESGNTGASDVYSFGIILYEIYSRKDPYEGEKDEDVIRQVCDPAVAKRPSVPPLMPPAMESMMRECLVAEASVRPTFHEIDSRLKRLDAVSVDSGYRHGHPWGSSVGQPVKQEHDEAAAARNATLLLEVFPPHIAAALRDGRKVEPEQHDCVTILFADVVGFTSISGALSPLKVADMLDRLYTTIDRLSEQHACFKLETIGDCWVGVTNLCRDQPDHATIMAAFALDCVDAARATLIDGDDPGRGCVELRVGMHSGPALANVVGARNRRFCLFGDSMNIAARMEANSRSGRLLCSEQTARLLADAPALSVVCRGWIDVKGKGEMTTFWVHRTHATTDNDEPPDKESSCSLVTANEQELYEAVSL